MRQMRVEDWVAHYVTQTTNARIEVPPTDEVLRQIVDDVITHPPIAPPVLNTTESSDTPPDYVRLLWLNELPQLLHEDLPVNDLTKWITSTFPEKGTADALLGLSKLLFDPDLDVSFREGSTKHYRTRDGLLEANSISITKALPSPTATK